LRKNITRLNTQLVDRINKSKASLELVRCGLWDEDIDEIIDLINKNKNIYTVNLSENSFSDAAIIKLINLKNVTSLQLSRMDIGNEGAIALVRHKPFIRLDLSKNQLIDNKAGTAILEIATQIHLDLSHTAIKPEIQNNISLRIQNNIIRYYEEQNKIQLDQPGSVSPLLENNFFDSNPVEDKEFKDHDFNNTNKPSAAKPGK
jgi:hypothetical protein